MPELSTHARRAGTVGTLLALFVASFVGFGAPAQARTHAPGSTGSPAPALPLVEQPQYRPLAPKSAPTVRAAVAPDVSTTPLHPGLYVPLKPARLLDTAAGTGVTAGAVPAHGSVAFLVAGRGGVPASGAGSVTLNVTVASATASGFATVYPSLTARPGTSNLNFSAGRTVANLVLATLGSDGMVRIYNGSAGTVRLVADVSGYFSAGVPVDAGAFRAVGPARVLDTAAPIGASAASAAARHTANVTIAGRGGVPSSGVSAVILNVTVASPHDAGYATVYPYGSSRPGTSSLNFPRGRTVPNLVVAQLGSGGRVSIYNGSSGSVRLVADVFGYFTTGTPTWGGAYHAIRPARLFDTRTDTGPIEGADNGYVPAHGTVRLFLDYPVGGLPAYGGAAVALNVTVTHTKRVGHLTAYPSDASRPNTSNLNFTAHDTVANAVVVKPAAYGGVSFYNSSSASVQIVVDVSGYIVPVPAMHFRTYDNLDQNYSQQTISCPTTTFCMAGVGDGRLQRFNGTSWSAPTTILDLDEVSAVSCSSASFCLAVSNYGNYAKFNGSKWTAGPGPLSIGGIGATAVSCVSSTFCVAVDQDGKAHRYNGSSWKTNVLSSQFLPVVSCTATTFCMAVDRAGRAIKFNGTSWSTSADVTSSSSGIGWLSCVSSTFCEFVDLPGNARTYNGTSWTALTPTGLTNGISLSCASRTNCIAAGGGAAALFNGSTWAPAGDLGGDALEMIDCPATTFCAAVTDDGYERTWTGTAWTAVRALDPVFGSANDVSCASSTFCLAVSDHGSAVFRTGSTWGTAKVLITRTPLVSASCPTSSFCMTISATQARSYSSGTWSATATPDPGGTLVDVSCASAGQCMAIDQDGNAFTYNGSTWSAAQVIDPTAHYPVAVSCPSTTDCTIAEGAGFIVTWDGSTFGAPVDLTAPGLDALDCATTTACTAVTSGGGVYRLTGTTWGAPTQLTDPGYGLSGVECPGATFCVIMSNQLTTAWTITGQGWASTDTSPIGLYGISCPTTLFCMGINGSTGIVGQRT